MKVYFNRLWQDLESQIEQTKNQKENHLTKVISLIEDSLEKLKVEIQKNQFKSDREEIHYFKHLKPQICSMLIFYKKINQIEIEKPQGSIQEKKDHLESELNRLTRYCKSNNNFYQYIRSGSTHLDEIYFTRELAKKNQMVESFAMEIDYNYGTGYDYRVAVFKAHEKLELHLNEQIDFLENPLRFTTKKENPNYEINFAKYNLHWTAKDCDLTELIYGLHASKALNEGNTNVTDIAKCITEAFNTTISNLHSSFQDIKNRKNGDLKFLESMQLHLKNRIYNDLDLDKTVLRKNTKK